MITLEIYLTGQSRIAKYTNPGAQVVTVIINTTTIENTLIDLGSAINMMTTTVLEALQLGQFLRPTTSITAPVFQFYAYLFEFLVTLCFQFLDHYEK